MTLLGLLFIIFELVVPPLQQPNAVHIGELLKSLYQGNCYERCRSAYQTNPDSLMVNGCICSQYKFVGMSSSTTNTCGYLNVTCLTDPGHHDIVNAFSFDLRRLRCQKVVVYARCAVSYGVASNIFQTFQECSRLCESSNRSFYSPM
ncbi:uncharacterized protein LOC106077210 [Biomphalaria glabrata]|uniref:Uncharacterized protein LOC106077210 n=1 Tax=Biomphalaria glabrata TaxID=6526 RepID=A0A9W2ZT98_BIOGL|nr:uncharacterized protein LOC106077210 [Biomphalaria glabrata]XP_055878230.1 uncharacterized protein LOC106077210 [Biomphalaria glabrata]XP_055878231.1 uncharacterized protein LOC106077210 [Biomphalaria glabrata]XP_055878232.1 uncharacterized protein LOC106077210 [Biomphalaria glabrata]